MKELNKLILYNSIITAILYSIVYLIRSFVVWEFRNPFQWIIDIPTEDNEYRAIAVFCFFGYYAILSTIVYNVIDSQKPGKINYDL